jgi:MYXO-CTERM domain-containing protein
MRFLTALSAAIVGVSLPLASLASPPSQSAIYTGHFPALAAKATPAAIESAARGLVIEKAPWSAGLTLENAKIHRFTSGERIVKLRQMHQGVPVVQRGATVAFKAGGAARLVAVDLASDLPSSVTPSISRVGAVAAAKARTGIGVDPQAAKLVVWPSPDGAVLAWVVYAPSMGLPYAPVVAVDATTGEVIQLYNAVRQVNQAQVYDTNPVKSPTLNDVTLPVGAGETTLQNELIQSMNCIDKKTVKTISMGITLDVHTCDLLQTALPDANGDYLIAPGGDKDPEDAFSEVSMFHHANRAYAYFREFKADFKVQDAPLPTISNLRLPDGYQDQNPSKLSDPDLPLVPFSNAFFAPADPLFEAVFGLQGAAMWFGQGPNRDYSYDGDVVYHEFTHAVVEATLKLVGTPHLDEYGTSYSPGAMNEGLADYFAAAIGGDPDIGEYASKDFAPGASAIRSLDNDDACPSAVGGEVHQDSTLFSGALWKVRTSLSAAQQPAFDAAVFTAMNSSATGDLGYEELAKLIASAITADATLGQGVAATLDAEYTTRGVLPHCTRVIEYAGAPIDGPDDFYGMLTSPGTSTTGTKGVAPGIVQIHADLPAHPTAMTVAFKKGPATGGGGGFGQGGTPFKPVLLVRFGADPITFKYKPFKIDDGVVQVDAVASGSTFTATLDVPADATSVYVMVANVGQTDGTYMGITLDVESSTGAGGAGGGGAGGAGGSGGAATTSAGGSGGAAPAPQTKATPASQEIGGCGCSVPNRSTSGGFAAIGLAALALLRRRKSRS